MSITASCVFGFTSAQAAQAAAATLEKVGLHPTVKGHVLRVKQTVEGDFYKVSIALSDAGAGAVGGAGSVSAPNYHAEKAFPRAFPGELDELPSALKRAIRAVFATDDDVVEGGRDHVRGEHLPTLIKAWPMLDDAQRESFVHLVCDHLDPVLRPVMIEALDVVVPPNSTPGVHHTAVNYLRGTFDSGLDLWDGAAVAAAVAQEKAKLGRG